MAINYGGYLDPGPYISEVVVPGQVSAATVPLTVCLIGIADRNKRASNEALTRGLVSNETLTVSATVSAHDATLVNISNRKSANLIVTADDVALDSTTDVSFRPATVTGSVLTTLNFTTNNKICLSLDGKQPVTIMPAGGGGDLTTIVGSLITQRLASIADISLVTPTQIAEAINKALLGATALGYGTAYGAVASVDAGKVIVTSPLSTSASDLRLYLAFPTAHDQTNPVFGKSLPYQAPTVIRLTNAAYGAGTAVFKAQYVSTNTYLDTLANEDVDSIVKVGSFAGVTSFIENTDFVQNPSGAVMRLDWSSDAAAVFTSSISAATYDISANDKIILAFDGKPSVTIDLNGLGSPPPGYANPVSAAAATLAEIVANINAVIVADASYGPPYRAVASSAGLQFVLTSPNQGIGSWVQIGAPTLLSASTALFGLTSGQMPYSINGTGSRPSAGAIYFATYEYLRPSDDFNVAKRFYTPDSLYAELGFQTATNQLAMAGAIAFDNGAPSVIAIQVDDTTFNGSPTQVEIQEALAAAEEVSSATDLIVLDTRLGVQVDLLNHVVNMSSPTQRNFRRGWFGMPVGTLIGDKDTPDTFVYRSARTLQVPGDSPGRGRLILIAPDSATRTITQEDGSQLDIELDGTFLAAGVAGRMTAFASPADTLMRKNITGFIIDSFPTYLKAERAQLASNGVTVITLDAGRLVLLDPMTTEGGGGRNAAFTEISASTQKDATTLAMTQALDANLIGIVPTDLASFIVTIKGYVANILRSMIANGSIGPFKTDEGLTRDVDLSKDIQVFQDQTDPTKYYFRYFFNLRYPAKRLFGDYSVNNPFWSA